MNVATLTRENYVDAMKWNEFYDNGLSLKTVHYDLSWHIMMSTLKANEKFSKLDKKIKDIVDKNKHMKIYPLPEYVFKAFVLTKASDLKVVFIGQDPYFNCEYHEGKHVPQAMGLSFSVPTGVAIPSSLQNIFENMVKFGHINKKPESGNLWFWAIQGCLMLNSALTVEDKSKESHIKLWEWFTDYVIEYISQYMDNIIFVLWGGYAYKKIDKIDLGKHHVIISSHPSGLSANTPFRDYPAFMAEDHFGKINDILKKINKTPILWA